MHEDAKAQGLEEQAVDTPGTPAGSLRVSIRMLRSSVPPNRPEPISHPQVPESPSDRQEPRSASRPDHQRGMRHAGIDHVDSHQNDDDNRDRPAKAPRRPPGQAMTAVSRRFGHESLVPSASVICWMDSASAGLTAWPCSLCAAATLPARVTTNRR